MTKIKDKNERNRTMYHSIQSRIKENHPDVVVIEDVVLQHSVKTLIELARLQGIIIGICDLYGINCVILKTTEWRKLLGFNQGKIKREDLKKQAISYIKEKYNQDVTSDEADAICIALAAKIKLNEEI